MLRNKKIMAIIFISLLFSVTASFAQNDSNVELSPFDPRAWGNVYEIPAMKNVTVKPNVQYFKDEKTTLTIDVYMPPEAKAGEKRAAVVFLNGIGDRVNDKVKNWIIYESWARLAAANDFVGITMEAAPGQIQDNFRALFKFLATDGEKYGVDGSRLGVYAASANVAESMKFLMDEKAAPNVRAAVLYYGFVVPEGKIRQDLPVLYVVAEGDLPRLGQPITEALWKQVTDNHAPWTLAFASRLPHGFEFYADNDESRRMVQQTIAFWKTYLGTPPQPNSPPSPEREIVAAIYGSNPQLAAELLKKYLDKHPKSAQALTQYGRMLQQLRRYDQAKTAFEKALKLVPDDAAIYGGIGQLYLAQGRNEEAAANLSKAVAGGFSNSVIYNQLATALMTLNRYEEAIKVYEKGIDAGIPKGTALYNIACVYVQLKQFDKAFEFLNKAIDAGFNNRNSFETDSDLSPIRSDARFQTLLARLAVN